MRARRHEARRTTRRASRCAGFHYRAGAVWPGAGFAGNVCPGAGAGASVGAGAGEFGRVPDSPGRFAPSWALGRGSWLGPAVPNTIMPAAASAMILPVSFLFSMVFVPFKVKRTSRSRQTVFSVFVSPALPSFRAPTSPGCHCRFTRRSHPQPRAARVINVGHSVPRLMRWARRIAPGLTGSVDHMPENMIDRSRSGVMLPPAARFPFHSGNGTVPDDGPSAGNGANQHRSVGRAGRLSHDK